MNLTHEQQAAVAHQLAHARIVAVAGAGKTATLTHYIAAQLARSSKPSRMLVLMYNRAAQRAFATRLQSLCEGRSNLPQVRTFHALGWRIYQKLINDGWLDAKQMQPLADMAIELQLKQLLQASHKARALVDTPEQLQEWVELCKQFILLVKCDIQPPEIVLEKLAPSNGEAVLLEVFRAFEAWRHQQQLITYDDMLYDPAQLFIKQPLSRQAFVDSFDEILVDEYQDINPIQHFLLQVIAGKRAQVMVIGDPDQTIYEFRGSSPQFITQYFARDFEAPTTYCLTRTFRFGHAIALCANQLISRNKVREPILTISAERTPQSKVQLAYCDDHGAKIVKAIKQLHAKGGVYSGMAVLCRMWSYARPVELELMAKGIPYRIEGENSILQCAEIRPFLHALELISGDFLHRSEEQRREALFELLTTPPLKIPHTLLRSVATQWARTLTSGPLRKSFIQALPPKLTPYQQRTLDLVAAALNQLTSKTPCANALQNYASVLDITQRLREGAMNPEKGQEQARTVTAFLQFVKAAPAPSAGEMRALLAQMQSSQQSPNLDAITITTIHRSKGLEWPVVFLPNMAEGHLPCNPGNERQRLDNERNRIESERRLMYVAITRVQKQLFITVPATGASASRFISEMNIPLSQEVARSIYQQQDALMVTQEPAAIVRSYLNELHCPLKLALAPTAEAAPEPLTERHQQWCIGDRVEHSILGLGHIRALDESRIHIHFDDGKTRVFHGDLVQPHLTFAREAY